MQAATPQRRGATMTLLFFCREIPKLQGD